MNLKKKNSESLTTGGPLYDDELGELTIDDLVGGGIRLVQPKKGYRVSMDTVLLAASVPAEKGQLILEAGSGSGGAALCLAHRCPGINVTGIEIQPAMVRLAERNAELNGLGERVKFQQGCVTERLEMPGHESFDHVFVNPPYLDPGAAIVSPSKTKRIAHMSTTASLKDWVMFSHYMVKNKGTMTFIYRADRLHELMALLARLSGDLVLCPLWPRTGVAAKRVLLQGRKGTHGAMTILPGISLHEAGKRYSREAEAVLRQGAALDLQALAKTTGV